MEIERIIEICKQRGEMEFLFQITKKIAEADSIGEEYTYCKEYTWEMFNDGQNFIQSPEYKERGLKDEYCPYLQYGGAPVYELYLNHLSKMYTCIKL